MCFLCAVMKKATEVLIDGYVSKCIRLNNNEASNRSKHTNMETGNMYRRHRLRQGLLTLALILHSRTQVVTTWGRPGNSFKGTLIFQMLLETTKLPNWRAEIQFGRSYAWRCKDVYLSLPISVAGWLSGHWMFTYDKDSRSLTTS